MTVVGVCDCFVTLEHIGCIITIAVVCNLCWKADKHVNQQSLCDPFTQVSVRPSFSTTTPVQSEISCISLPHWFLIYFQFSSGNVYFLPYTYLFTSFSFHFNFCSVTQRVCYLVLYLLFFNLGGLLGHPHPAWSNGIHVPRNWRLHNYQVWIWILDALLRQPCWENWVVQCFGIQFV